MNRKQKIIIEHVKHIFHTTFQILLFLFLITLLLREFYQTTIDSLININWFMFAVIIVGAISIIFPPKIKKQKEKPITWKDKVFIIILGILGAGIIYLKLKDLGWIGYAIAILGGLIIILLSWMVLTEKDEPENKNESHYEPPQEERDYSIEDRNRISHYS